jgi:alpha-N-arabinofuranosidase
MKVFIESPRVEVANFFKLVEPTFMGWIGLRDGKYAAKAPYLAFQMFTQHFGSRLVHTETSSPAFDSRATGLVAAARDVPYLDAVSSLDADGRRLYLLVINKHFDDALSARVRIDGFKPDREGKRWRLSGSALDANTGTELPDVPGVDWADQVESEEKRFDKGGPGEVGIEEGKFDASESFEMSFPRHSVTVLEMVRSR